MSDYSKYLRPEEMDDLISHQLKEIQELKNVIKAARELAYAAPELNMSNFDIDQIEALNSAMCEIFGLLEQAIED